MIRQTIKKYNSELLGIIIIIFILVVMMLIISISYLRLNNYEINKEREAIIKEKYWKTYVYTEEYSKNNSVDSKYQVIEWIAGKVFVEKGTDLSKISYHKVKENKNLRVIKKEVKYFIKIKSKDDNLLRMGVFDNSYDEDGFYSVIISLSKKEFNKYTIGKTEHFSRKFIENHRED